MRLRLYGRSTVDLRRFRSNLFENFLPNRYHLMDFVERRAWVLSAQRTVVHSFILSAFSNCTGQTVAEESLTLARMTAIAVDILSGYLHLEFA